MKGRTTLILLASIVLLGLFIWIQESWVAGTPVRQNRKIRLFDLDADSLMSIEFRFTNTVVHIAQDNGIWMAGVAKGNMGRGDLELIQRLISGLNSLGKGTVITPKHLEIRGLESAEYGFESPAVEISVVDIQGRRRWLVGRKTPLGNMVYVRLVGDEDIYTISDKLLQFIPANPDAIRDRQLFDSEMAGVRRIEVRGPAGFVQLLKDSHAAWHVHQPVSALADSKEVDDFISKLYRFRIEEFIADNVSDFSIYGLQGEARQISLAGSDGTSRTLIVGDEVPGQAGFVYVRRADDTSVFTLDNEILRFLNVPSERFLDVAVYELPEKGVSSIRISRGTEEVTLVQSDSAEWSITQPVQWPADAKEVSDLIALWTSAVITEFNVSGASAESEWFFEFASAGSGLTNTIQVLFSKGKKDGLLIRRGSDPSVCQINLPQIPNSVINPLSYKNKRVWVLDQADISRVAIIQANAPRQVIERVDAFSFAPAETNGNVQVDVQASNRLLWQLNNLKAQEYIAHNPRDLEIYGLVKPSLELQIGLSTPGELGRVLLVGHETADGFYCMVKGRDVVFYLGQQQVEALSANILTSQSTSFPKE